MKIAHIGPSNLPILFSRGGAVERRMVELAREQAAQGHEVTVYSAEDTDRERLVDGFRYRSIACRGRGWLRSLHFLARAGTHAQRETADLLHFHNVPEGIWFTRRPCGVRVLSYDYFRSRRWQHALPYRIYRRTLMRYDRLLPVSKYCLRESQAFWQLPGSRMSVLYNGVNLEQFCPGAEPAASVLQSTPGNSPVVLYVGRVCEQKGTDVLLHAYRLLRQRMPGVQLLVAGPAGQFGMSQPSALVHAIQEAGGTYLGAVEEADLAATYRRGTVYVMATVRDEMFGMAAIEAQACGLPVVCSEQGGLPEVVPPTSGRHVPPGDASALADQLQTLLSDSGLYRELASAARPNANRFSWPAIVAEMFHIYEDVCRQPAGYGQSAAAAYKSSPMA